MAGLISFFLLFALVNSAPFEMRDYDSFYYDIDYSTTYLAVTVPSPQIVVETTTLTSTTSRVMRITTSAASSVKPTTVPFDYDALFTAANEDIETNNISTTVLPWDLSTNTSFNSTGSPKSGSDTG